MLFFVEWSSFWLPSLSYGSGSWPQFGWSQRIVHWWPRRSSKEFSTILLQLLFCSWCVAVYCIWQNFVPRTILLRSVAVICLQFWKCWENIRNDMCAHFCSAAKFGPKQYKKIFWPAKAPPRLKPGANCRSARIVGDYAPRANGCWQGLPIWLAHKSDLQLKVNELSAHGSGSLTPYINK